VLLSDRPILCAAEDQLGFQPFSATLAKGLREMAPAEGLVVALHAPWGSGKTSALNLIQRHLAVLDIAELTRKSIDGIAKMAAASKDAASDEERKLAYGWEKLVEKHEKKLKTTVIRFNPWYFSGQENLFKAFFGVLGTELSVVNNTKVASAVAAVLKRGDAAGSALGAAIGMTLAGPAGVAGGASIGGLFGKLANDKFDKKESLEATLQQLRQALQASDRRLLIIIDDIDRLMPDELRQMLALIKSLGNMPNITYLLSFDRAEVVKLIDQAGITNADYLEKIVQVSFELPRVDRYALRTMFFNRLDAIRGGKDLEDTRRWGEAFFLYIEPQLKTPRDVTRLCNSLQLIWPALEDEVDWSDLVVLEVLRLQEPGIYERIIEKLGYLTGEVQDYAEKGAWAVDLKPNANNSSNPQLVADAMTYLFPRVAKAWDYRDFSSVNDSDAQRNRRLQSADYARNYFTLAPAPDQFTSAEIRDLFSSSSPVAAFDKLLDRAKTRKTRKDLTMVSRLLEQITEEIGTNQKLQASFAQAILARVEEIIEVRDVERTLFSTDNSLRLSWLFVAALKALPKDDRAAVAKAWLSTGAGTIFFAPFIETMTGKNANGDYLFPPETYDDLREAARRAVQDFTANSDFLKGRDGARFLFSWARLTNYENVAVWLTPHLDDDEVVLRMAKLMPSEFVSSATGVGYRLDRKAWANMMDVDKFIGKLRKIGKKRKGEDAVDAIVKQFETAMAMGDDD